MGINSNTNKDVVSWPETIKKQVWNKGEIIAGFPADMWRRDKCKTPMKWDDYGNRNVDYGWEIDHIVPVTNGGRDTLDNLQPLQWENNAKKGDSLNFRC